MQSIILLVIMTLAVMAAEMSRNRHGESHMADKSKNVAANILQYQDLVIQYMLANYEKLHPDFSSNPDHVEKIELLDYKNNNIGIYSQKKFNQFLNYRSLVFNYVKSMPNENVVIPVLYVATSFDGYTDNNIYKTYLNTGLPEVMGHLGEYLSKHLYQGNSTYWTVPWLFSQKDCNVIEVYSQIPDNVAGSNDEKSNYGQVQALFKQFCNQIQAFSSYRFLTYVYIQPVFNPANI